jgi:hypothetical protein
MSAQLPLFDEPDDLRCAAGYPWLAYHLRSDGVRCPGCQALSEASERRFWADVAAGIYDERGYTPEDIKRRDRRAA